MSGKAKFTITGKHKIERWESYLAIIKRKTLKNIMNNKGQYLWFYVVLKSKSLPFPEAEKLSTTVRS